MNRVDRPTQAQEVVIKATEVPPTLLSVPFPKAMEEMVVQPRLPLPWPWRSDSREGMYCTPSHGSAYLSYYIHAVTNALGFGYGGGSGGAGGLMGGDGGGGLTTLAPMRQARLVVGGLHINSAGQGGTLGVTCPGRNGP